MPGLNFAKWAPVRARVLERDGYRCRLMFEGCTVKATQVDHIIPRAAGGSLYDDRNCRAVCAPCHKKRPPVQAYSGNTSREW